MPPKEFHAFISYSRKDGVGFVTRLKQLLSQDADGSHLKLWRDRERMEGDKDWWLQITDAIDKSEYLVLVITPEALRSGICQREWRYAREKGVCVRPVKGVPDREIQYDLLPAGMRDSHIYDIDEEWRKFVNDLTRSCHTNRTVFLAPPKPGDFIQRQDIYDSLKKQLLEDDSTKTISLNSALKGAGGFGKTTMAIAICHDENIREKYHGGILWATIGEDGNLHREVTKIYYALTGENSVFVDEEEASRILAEKISHGKYLIVFDDVWNYSDINNLAERIKNIKDSAILITTRLDNVVQQSGSTECEVNEMKMNEARQFLTSGWDIRAEHNAVIDELLSATGGWFILLKLIKGAGIMSLKKGASLYQTLLDLRETYATEGLTAFDIRNSKRRNEAVDRCIGASLGLLSKDEVNKCLMLGVFATDNPIPISIISQYWGVSILSAKKLLQQLDNYALLQLDLSKEVALFHDVFLSYYKEKLGEDLGAMHSLLVKSFPEKFRFTNAYSWNYYAWHLKESGDLSLYWDVLKNFDWIEAKLFATGINELIVDYTHAGLDHDSRLIGRALRNAAHILVNDRIQLAGQLVGRLRNIGGNAIAVLTEKARQWQNENGWLCPKTRSLIPPEELFMVLTGHGAGVSHVVIAGEKIVSASLDQTIGVWDINTGRQVFQIVPGFDGVIGCIRVSEGKIVASNKKDRIQVWDLSNGNFLYELEPAGGQVDQVEISGSKGAFLQRGKFCIWDIHSGEMRPVEWPSGRFETQPLSEIILQDDKIIAGYRITTEKEKWIGLYMWDLNTGQFNCEITNQTFAYTAPASRDIIDFYGRTMVVLENKSIRFLEMGTAAFSADLPVDVTEPFSSIHVQDDKIICRSATKIMIWDAVSKQLLYVIDDKDISSLLISQNMLVVFKVWDFYLFDLISRKKLTKHLSRPRSPSAIKFLFVGDKLLAWSGQLIWTWSWEKGEVEHKMLSGHTSAISELITDGHRVISASDDKTIGIWDIETGETISTQQQFHKDAVSALTAWNSLFISGSADGSIQVWDQSGNPAGKPLSGHKKRVSKLLFSGEKLISSGGDIRVWEIYTGDQIGEPLEGSEELAAVNKQIVVGVSSKVISAWDLNTQKSIWETKAGKREIDQVIVVEDRVINSEYEDFIRIRNLYTGLGPTEPMKGQSSTIVRIAVEKGRVVAVSNSNTILVWGLSSRVLLYEKPTGHQYKITQLVINDGKIITASQDKTVRVFDLETGKEICGPFNIPSALDIRLLYHDGKIICSSSTSIKVWDINTGQLTGVMMNGHTGKISKIVCVNDKIISAGADKCIRVWDMNNSLLLAAFEVDQEITKLIVSGNQIVAGDRMGKLHFLEPVGFRF